MILTPVIACRTRLSSLGIDQPGTRDVQFTTGAREKHLAPHEADHTQVSPLRYRARFCPARRVGFRRRAEEIALAAAGVDFVT